MRSKRLLAVVLLGSLLVTGASWFSARALGPSRLTDVGEPPGADADLPPMLVGRIDKATYLQLRDEFISRLRGIEPGSTLDPAIRSTAIQQMERQIALQTLRLSPDAMQSGPVWTPLGPAPLPNGQTQQFPANPQPMSGRATAIVVDPTNSSKVYLGTAQGGVWRSTDGGTTWTAIFDTAQSLAVGTLALAPSDPTKLYVGTGEPNFSGDTFFGVGVYRIDNVDTSPILVGPMNPQITTGTTVQITTNCFTGRAISKIVVHPTDPATIFVATTAGISGVGSSALSNTSPPLGLLGLYRSTNATSAAASVTFAKLVVTTMGSLDTPGTGNTNITDIVLEPGNPNNLLAGVSGANPGSGGGVFRSTNALAATPTFSQTLTPGFIGLVHHLAINKVGSTVTAYVTSNEPSTCAAGGAGRVRKSTDAGASWGVPLASAEGFCAGQCGYDQPIALHPNDASLVYLGGNARGTCSDVLKRSPDGGATFVRDDNGLHADAHAIYIDPLTTPATIWFVSDGGVFERQDAAPGTAWTNRNQTGLGTFQFQSVAVHPTDQLFTLGGSQDNGTEVMMTTSGNWAGVASGDGGYTLVDQSATDTGSNLHAVYHTFFNIKNGLVGFQRAGDGSCLGTKDSWPNRGFNFGPDNLNPACDGTAITKNPGFPGNEDVSFYAPMALGPGNPNTFYFATDKLYRSTDRGDTVTAVSQTISSGNQITAIGIHPANDGIRLVGTRDGLVFGTLTGGNPMVSFGFTAPANADATTTSRYISRIVVDPNNPNTAYLTLSYYTNPSSAGQIWKTTNLNLLRAGDGPDGVATWSSVSNGVPNVPVNALVIDPVCVDHLFAGTDIGVYETTDGGFNWAPFGSGLPRVAVFDLALQPTGRILRAATHGRGMWEAKLNGPCANLQDQGMIVDPSADSSNGNGILEPGERVFVQPAYKNVSGSSVAGLTGSASNFTGPAGASYTINDTSAGYGTISPGATNNCTATANCYEMSVSNPISRPATHWDATFDETLNNGAPIVTRKLHVGGSFIDVPTSHVFYPFVERIFHAGITTGCNAGTMYCPDDNVFRLQMAVFIARAQAGGDANIPVSGSAQGNPYNCVAVGGQSQFTDIAASDPFCRHVHYIFSTGVTTGCVTTPPRQYCPSDNVSRGQMALFIARAVAGGDASVPVTYGPDPVTGRSYSCDPMSPNLHFIDITTSDIFCRHTHFLWAKDVISGFPDNSYQPNLNVSRGAMSKFLA
ncbi:MAG TPA: S-layer homology domain-containing protein, partial [Thermoanaerobaculia bacterium]|nr:S-layer homology domain-containing protein [Thermoanaerobaculia bacterium]